MWQRPAGGWPAISCLGPNGSEGPLLQVTGCHWHPFRIPERLGSHVCFETFYKKMCHTQSTTSDGLEFFPLLFDYLRRKYDHDHNNTNNDTTTQIMMHKY